jgi:hypothetical protein
MVTKLERLPVDSIAVTSCCKPSMNLSIAVLHLLLCLRCYSGSSRAGSSLHELLADCPQFLVAFRAVLG